MFSQAGKYLIIKNSVVLTLIILIIENADSQKYFSDSTLNTIIGELKRDTGQNLVPNCSFERYSLCPDGCSVVPKSYFVDDWIMATLGTPDYFNFCSDKSGVPTNWVGKLYAKTGAGYAGLIPGMYINSNQNPEEKREYIEAKLKEKLKKDEYYFLGFSTSLAGMSQYAINGIGLYLSDTLINISNSIYHLPFTPQLLNKNNEVITEKSKWRNIGGLYKAIGGETYILLGNFQSDEDTRVIDTERPGSLNCSYYLFDDIYVIPLSRNEKFATLNIKPDNSVSGKLFTIHFNFADATLRQNEICILDSIVRLKKSNPSLHFEISGYTDSIGSESYNMHLSKHRIKAVSDYLVTHSLKLKEIEKKAFGEKYPVSDNGTEKGRAMNRRVEINIK
jgi:OmpA-OmpF porin, OOP family